MAKAKIICTIGPASDNYSVLRKMMLAGMDVARLNFSHGNHLSHQKRIALIRKLNAKYRRHIRILQDLEGYRIRIGKLKHGPVVLKKKQVLYLAKENSLPDKPHIPFDYPDKLSFIRKGALIFIDDGNICLQVKRSADYYLQAEVVIGGLLKESKGVNIPGVNLRFRGITDKDRRDVEFGICNKVDFIAQSFVRDALDVQKIRDMILDRLPSCKIIAKIENRAGLKNIDSIIEASDGIMIARGDMGVSIPLEEVPVMQKYIIKRCRRAGKFVITATQMLESMVENIRPTRAEASDVANAVFDGSGYLMLSAESAAGKYPVQATRFMNQVIGFTERYIDSGYKLGENLK
ncbi:MAG: pyruvate kinase [Candidatus Omnitrophota bacterium]|jgi:pyruvate kinase|nr:MAG: pyruvate kinase [Candidatus Omnitrophota bacterium]